MGNSEAALQQGFDGEISGSSDLAELRTALSRTVSRSVSAGDTRRVYAVYDGYLMGSKE